MLWTLLATSLLAGQTQAGGIIDQAMGLSEAAVLTVRQPGDNSNNNNEAEPIVPRDTVANTTGGMITVGHDVSLNADGTINMAAWDETVTAACNAALSKLTQSSNPSGTCTCYNLPALNNATGVFEADLRLFQISTPRDAFSAISPENVQVGLSYAGASVSPISMSGSSSSNSSSSTTTATTTTSANSTTAGLKLLQHYMFVGQITKSLLTPNMDMAQLEALVMPQVTLTGTAVDGAKVSTNVSSNEAAFVAGIFSDTVVMSNATKAAKAVSSVVAALEAKTVAFVLPGVQLILFPIGLIITSVWLVIGIAVIGMGFVQRVSFRESYRTRAMQSAKGGFGTI